MADGAPVGKRGCFKRGCFGCLAVFGVGLVIVMVLALIAVIQGVPDVVRESDEVAHELPAAEWTPPAPGEPMLVDSDQVGRVVLDVTIATFRIHPAPAGTPVRLEANYDSGSYKLEESFSNSGELGWTYRLDFRKRRAISFTVDPDNKLDLYLPADTPITLEGELGIGQYEVELGGLWIEEVDLKTSIGQHTIRFSEPLAKPMGDFKVSGSIGEMSVRGLGNASPSEVRVRHSIGEAYVDLRGSWQNDSELTIGSSIGECRVRLPGEEVGIALSGGLRGIGDFDSRRARDRPDPPEGAPTLRLKLSHSLGELRLTD